MTARFVKVLIDAFAALTALIVAYSLVFSISRADWLTLSLGLGGPSLLIYAILAGIVSIGLKNDRNAWRFTSFHDCLLLLHASWISAAGLLAWNFVMDRGNDLPRSVLFIATVLDLSFMVAARMAIRLYRDQTGLHVFRGGYQPNSKTLANTLLVGSDRAIDAYLRDPRRLMGEDLVVSGALALGENWKSGDIRGVRVIGGVHELFPIVDRLVQRGQPVLNILILEEDLLHDGTIPADTFTKARDRHIRLLRLPRISELAPSGSSNPFAPRDVSFEDLLRRPSINFVPEVIVALLSGQRVLVTGAGGSIGSELCRQITALECAHLTCLDSSEYNLYTIDEELTRAAPALPHSAVLCDVRDPRALEAAMNTHRPDIVFHAAALKHVPLMEANPVAAAGTNVIGTRNARRAAEISGCRIFVLVSTDKSVAPSSVMGRTKRIAEALTRIPAKRSTASPMKTVVVRFGNVLGSAGSVIPLFRAQLERGGPVTVTHPDVERYFMTIPEAVSLIFHAAALRGVGRHAPEGIFVLEMGNPIKIVDLARQVARSYDLELGKDVELTFVGLRPGEKIREELVDEGETAHPSEVDGIRRVVSSMPSGEYLHQAVDRLETLVAVHDTAGVHRTLMDLVSSIRGNATASGKVVSLPPTDELQASRTIS